MPDSSQKKQWHPRTSAVEVHWPCNWVHSPSQSPKHAPWHCDLLVQGQPPCPVGQSQYWCDTTQLPPSAWQAASSAALRHVSQRLSTCGSPHAVVVPVPDAPPLQSPVAPPVLPLAPPVAAPDPPRVLAPPVAAPLVLEAPAAPLVLEVPPASDSRTLALAPQPTSTARSAATSSARVSKTLSILLFECAMTLGTMGQEKQLGAPG